MKSVIKTMTKIANALDGYGHIDCAADVDNIIVKLAAIDEEETKRRLVSLLKQFEDDPMSIIGEIKEERPLSGVSSVGLWMQMKLEMESYNSSFYPNVKFLYDKLKNKIFLYAAEHNLVDEENEQGLESLMVKRHSSNGRIKIASEPKNIVVDVDGTIFEYDKYQFGKFGKPIDEVIEFLKGAKDDGYGLILFTARSWAEYGALEKALKDNDIGDLFDEIVMGKPIGKVYLDDRAINILDEEWESKAKELLGKKNEDT